MRGRLCPTSLLRSPAGPRRVTWSIWKGVRRVFELVER